MNAVRARVELCYRILAALEGKAPRKIPDDRIAKMKIQLEKMEAKALKQEERMRLAEERAKQKIKAAEEKAALAEKNRIDREKKRKEKEDLKNAKQSSAKKKIAQTKARSDFMMRFLTPQKQADPSIRRSISLESPDRPVVPVADLPSDVEVVETSFHLAPYAEPWVMPTALWLRTLVDYDIKASNLDFLKNPIDGIGIDSFKKHMKDMALRLKIAQRKISPVLQQYRNERTQGRDNKSPRFALRRYQVRGRRASGVLKLLKFDENHRPAYFGTKRARSKKITGRRPFVKDESLELNYDVNSDDEWEAEAEDGESLSDIEDDKEMAKEDDELRILYGSDDESDDEDFLDDEGADVVDDDDDSLGSPEKKMNLEEEVSIVAEKRNVIDVDNWSQVAQATVPGTKKRAADGKLKDESKRKRRRKSKGPKAVRVEIIGVDYSDNASPLDYYTVTKFISAAPFKAFDLVEEEKLLAELNTPKKARKPKKKPIMPTAESAPKSTPVKALKFNGNSKSPGVIKKSRGGIKVITAPLPPPTVPPAYAALLPTSNAEILGAYFPPPKAPKSSKKTKKNIVQQPNVPLATSIIPTAHSAQPSSNEHQA